jgi:hypothetical protein
MCLYGDVTAVSSGPTISAFRNWGIPRQINKHTQTARRSHTPPFILSNKDSRLRIYLALVSEIHPKPHMMLHIPNYYIYRSGIKDGNKDGNAHAVRKGIAHLYEDLSPLLSSRTNGRLIYKYHSGNWPTFSRAVDITLPGGDKRCFLYSTASRAALGPTKPPSRWYPGLIPRG